MKHPVTILVADRNPYVRRFLQRELMHAGYPVVLAEDCGQVLFWVNNATALDMVILDPDLPGMEVKAVLRYLLNRFPRVTVVLHGHPDQEPTGPMIGGTVFIEKGGNSIESIIKELEKPLRSGSRVEKVAK